MVVCDVLKALREALARIEPPQLLARPHQMQVADQHEFHDASAALSRDSRKSPAACTIG